MAFSDEQITDLRSKLSLPEDADETTILAMVDEVVDKATAPAPKAKEAVPEGMTLIETGVLAELKAGAAAGQAAGKQLAEQKRDQAIEAAIKAGKTTPARREHWAKSWDADPEGTKQLLDGLEAGLVPIEEKGHAQDGDAETTLSPADAAELDSFLSGLGLSKEDIDG